MENTVAVMTGNIFDFYIFIKGRLYMLKFYFSYNFFYVKLQLCLISLFFVSGQLINLDKSEISFSRNVLEVKKICSKIEYKLRR
jgi:hypothetical protein